MGLTNGSAFAHLYKIHCVLSLLAAFTFEQVITLPFVSPLTSIGGGLFSWDFFCFWAFFSFCFVFGKEGEFSFWWDLITAWQAALKKFVACIQSLERNNICLLGVHKAYDKEWKMVWFSILYHRIVPQSDRWKIVIVGDQNSSCPWAQNSKLPLPAYLLFQRGDSLSHMQVFFFNLTEGQKKGGGCNPSWLHILL